jgi:two-component sensor histidine kinase
VQDKPQWSDGAVQEGVAEALRRATVKGVREADTGSDPDFTRVARAAARLFNAPAAALVILEDDELWLYARFGLEHDSMPAAASPFAAIVNTSDITSLVVPDAMADPAFAGAFLGIQSPPMRFYAGVPLAVHGRKIGALGVMSPEPGLAADDQQLEALGDLAALAGSLFELKDEARVRDRMAAELVKEEWRHALTLEAGKVGSWVWDLRTGDIISNDIFRRMLGVDSSSQLHVDELMQRIDPADIAGVEAALAATFEDGADYATEFRIRQTGRWLIGRGRVYQRDAAGKPLIMMGVNIDVTDAREAAEQTRVLLRELNHRVKNTLAMIQSLARQTLRQKPDPQQFIDAFSGRLRMLSEAHGLLADRDWSGIGLIELLKSQVEPYLLDSPEQFAFAGNDLRLPPDHALGLGLIIHELASNAVKFGALSQPGGRVKVSWIESGGPPRRIELIWQESGGPTVGAPRETGFGTWLIQRSLDKVLDSSVELSFPESGAVAKISLPIA